MIECRIIENIVYLAGELKIETVEQVVATINRYIHENQPAQLMLNLANVSAIDSAGVACLDELREWCRDRDIAFELIQIPDAIFQALQSFSTAALPAEIILPQTSFFDMMQKQLTHFKHSALTLLYLTADIFYWSVVGLVHRKGQRAGSFIQQSLLIGVNALTIVGLISFLIGLILALQSAAQLRQFGANIYVADLIGIAMLREMGPIMTAIVVAGRSGSAIASEIATMVVTEEIDALQTMALNPIRFVIVPKFHAITLTMPLLTVFADLIGIIGGYIIGVTYLQLSAAAFFNELLTVLYLKDVLTGLFKSIVFAWIIAVIGCYFGLQVKGGAEGVGRATTASVVASIFFVIVADSILGLIFYFE